MSEQFLETLALGAGTCHPDCVRARNEQEDHNASQSAALVAVSLISSARVILKLDTEYTVYSAQYLVDNAGPKKEGDQGEMDPQRCEFTFENIVMYLRDNVWNRQENGQGEMDQQDCELTLKDCLQFALKEGLPKAEHWAHLGCTFKPPPFATLIPRVPMKGEVVEAKDWDEAFKLLRQQPVGAKLHVFSPELDRLGDAIYDGPSGTPDTRYVGLRDVIVVAVEKIEGVTVATVQMCYKKKTLFVKVSLSRTFTQALHDGDNSQVIGPTGLLVDFCIPRLFTQ